MRSKRLVLALKLLVAAAAIVWLFTSKKLNLEDLSRVGEGWPWLAASALPFGLLLFLCAYRWKLLLRAQGIEYGLGDAYSLTMIGHFFNQFLIGTTGGDMVKAYAVAREQPSRRSGAVLSVFVDRIVGLLVLVLVALVAAVLNARTILAEPRLVFLASMVAVVFAASLLGGWLFYSERMRS
ncbi:MAG TPA: lysylphosphatidylglycerol synthase transmembrane domain-containing protein, partial [Planctomycetota bacterium]|nr:lysylphosphatidylglycerol synthase transmembrane domain-containing protein [Planctomycetota bacterium]